jgi:hypothetical protein
MLAEFFHWEGTVDQRDDHDSHEVVPLRRKDDPDAAERAKLASQIFAQEDEIGTFSRGNLIPPPTTSDEPASTDGSDALLQRLGLRNKDESGLRGTSKGQPGEPDILPGAIAAHTPTGLAAEARSPKSASDLPRSTSPQSTLPRSQARPGYAGRSSPEAHAWRPGRFAHGGKPAARRGESSRYRRSRGRSSLLTLAIIAAIAGAIPLTLLALGSGGKPAADRHGPAVQANARRFDSTATVGITTSKHPPLRPTNPASGVEHRPRHSLGTVGPKHRPKNPNQSSTATCCTTGTDVAQVDTQLTDTSTASNQPTQSATGSSGTPAPESTNQPTATGPGRTQTSSQTTTSRSTGPKSPYSTFGPGS